jgi:hypothetical protein
VDRKRLLGGGSVGGVRVWEKLNLAVKNAPTIHKVSHIWTRNASWARAFRDDAGGPSPKHRTSMGEFWGVTGKASSFNESRRTSFSTNKRRVHLHVRGGNVRGRDDTRTITPRKPVLCSQLVRALIQSDTWRSWLLAQPTLAPFTRSRGCERVSVFEHRVLCGRRLRRGRHRGCVYR